MLPDPGLPAPALHWFPSSSLASPALVSCSWFPDPVPVPGFLILFPGSCLLFLDSSLLVPVSSTTVLHFLALGRSAQRRVHPPGSRVLQETGRTTDLLLPANIHLLESQSPDTSHSTPICLPTFLHVDSNVTKPPPGSPQAPSLVRDESRSLDSLSTNLRHEKCAIWRSTSLPSGLECNSLVTTTSPPTEPTLDMPPQPSSQRFSSTNQNLKTQSPPAMQPQRTPSPTVLDIVLSGDISLPPVPEIL
ncbi:hypothetical protein TNIN_215351 [Trichonephila inaurata madagascariensis]|uniref:Uncharacterized protein n=1 Tax=Trichonephila inaurata madagascariensis TaxID=2747483 RepID=A0A8X6IA00_9ARAC|nr:hypothetical protein TNIN_215351 [Trichonephila inaurata madagascariensis]